jgi:hypothetical protein
MTLACEQQDILIATNPKELLAIASDLRNYRLKWTKLEETKRTMQKLHGEIRSLKYCHPNASYYPVSRGEGKIVIIRDPSKTAETNEYLLVIGEYGKVEIYLDEICWNNNELVPEYALEDIPNPCILLNDILARTKEEITLRRGLKDSQHYRLQILHGYSLDKLIAEINHLHQMRLE